jgi:hypothetical protein
MFTSDEVGYVVSRKRGIKRWIMKAQGVVKRSNQTTFLALFDNKLKV